MRRLARWPLSPANISLRSVAYRVAGAVFAALTIGIASVMWLSFSHTHFRLQRHTVGPAPLSAALMPSDIPVARALRTLMPKEIRNFVVGAPRTAIERFYIARGFAPLWLDNGVPSSRYLAARKYLEDVANFGLDPIDYLDPAVTFIGTADQLAWDELKFTAQLLLYLRHARDGRLDFSRVGTDIDYERRAFDAAQALDAVAQASDIDALLDSVQPSHPAFRSLHDKLIELSGGHGAEDGDRLRSTILANMERWRWMPRDLGDTYILVNVPDFRVQFFAGGSLRFVARTVVGDQAAMTPLLSATMTSITVNPIWNIPQTIATREILPALKQDPELMRQFGLRVRHEGSGLPQVSQLPGEANPLGHFRFNIPNRFHVFLHDTPVDDVYQVPIRAESHGCVRVENPIYFARTLLEVARPGGDYSPSALWKLFGDKEVDISFRTPIATHLTYQTAFVDADGVLTRRDDIYGRDRAIFGALALDAQSREARRAQQGEVRAQLTKKAAH
jgi:L,D-transpeptidase YcbB